MWRPEEIRRLIALYLEDGLMPSERQREPGDDAIDDDEEPTTTLGELLTRWKTDQGDQRARRRNRLSAIVAEGSSHRPRR